MEGRAHVSRRAKTPNERKTELMRPPSGVGGVRTAGNRVCTRRHVSATQTTPSLQGRGREPTGDGAARDLFRRRTRGLRGRPSLGRAETNDACCILAVAIFGDALHVTSKLVQRRHVGHLVDLVQPDVVELAPLVLREAHAVTCRRHRRRQSPMVGNEGKAKEARRENERVAYRMMDDSALFHGCHGCGGGVGTVGRGRSIDADAGAEVGAVDASDVDGASGVLRPRRGRRV